MVKNKLLMGLKHSKRLKPKIMKNLKKNKFQKKNTNSWFKLLKKIIQISMNQLSAEPD